MGYEWVSTGQLPNLGAVWSLCVYNNKLYGGGGHGSEVFRYDGDDNWVSVGTFGGTYVSNLYVFNNNLYASALGSASIHKYLGGSSWSSYPVGGGSSCYNLCEFNNKLHTGVYSWHVFRDDIGNGTPWTSIGYFAPYIDCTWLITFDGNLYLGTRRAGPPPYESPIYRYVSDGNWTKTGAIPGKSRIWCGTIHNNKLYWGTNTPAKVWEGTDAGTDLGTIGSNTRVWALCSFDNKLWAGGEFDSHAYFYDNGWQDGGVVGGSIHDFCVYEGDLYAATTDNGQVYKYKLVSKSGSSSLQLFAKMLIG